LTEVTTPKQRLYYDTQFAIRGGAERLSQSKYMYHQITLQIKLHSQEIMTHISVLTYKLKQVCNA